MSDEQPLIGLAEAARRLGRTGRGGGSVHPATLTRWIAKGVAAPSGERVKLRAVRIGSKWATRPEWLDAFVARTTAASAFAEPVMRTPAERQRACAAATAELELIGA